MREIRFHDPLIVPEDNSFYCFSTDTNINGVQISKSEDLLDWRLLKPALAYIPDYVKRHVGVEYFWAPELIKVDGIWRLYSCASRFGTTQSTIFLSTSASLEEDFEPQGEVIRTYERDDKNTPNAIDPNVVSDESGRQYLVYGSFFGGIWIKRLDANGFIYTSGYGKKIAGGLNRPIEGAYIYYNQNTNFYYLFISYGDLNNDYHIRVARSRNIEGPYIDSSGEDLNNLDPIKHPGDKLIGSYNLYKEPGEAFIAPGHNSILEIGDEIFIVHHVRKENENKSKSYLQIRRLYFLNNGQVVASPLTHPENKTREALDFKTNKLNLIRFTKFNNDISYPFATNIEGCKFLDNQEIVLKISNDYYRGKTFISDKTQYVTCINTDGECIWGYYRL